MAREICSICLDEGKSAAEATIPINEGRTAHLKHAHGIDPYHGCVRDYYLHPWELPEANISVK